MQMPASSRHYPMRLPLANDIHVLVRDETERTAGKGRVFLPTTEVNDGALANSVHYFHARQTCRAETERGVLETGLGFTLGAERQPLHAITRRGFLADIVLAVKLRRIDQRSERAVLLFLALRAHRGLF